MRYLVNILIDGALFEDMQTHVHPYLAAGADFYVRHGEPLEALITSKAHAHASWSMGFMELPYMVTYYTDLVPQFSHLGLSI